MMQAPSNSLENPDLRTHIRALLETETLPLRSPEQQFYGGSGSGQLCDCCGRPICVSEILYEVESPRHSLLAMHLPCLDAWEIESRGRRVVRREFPYMRCAF